MAEIVHGEPGSIIETHLGVKPIDTSELGPIKFDPMRGSAREQLEMLARHGTDDSAKVVVDAILDQLIAASRPYSGFATLFLKRVKEGRI
jgi:hypothetical protein